MRFLFKVIDTDDIHQIFRTQTYNLSCSTKGVLIYIARSSCDQSDSVNTNSVYSRCVESIVVHIIVSLPVQINRDLNESKSKFKVFVEHMVPLQATQSELSKVASMR